MKQIQINKKLVTNQEFIKDLSWKFELNLDRDWSDYQNQYKQKIEIVEDNRMFIIQIYVDDKLIYDLQQEQQKNIDQCVEFNKQELADKEKTEKLGYKIDKWNLYPCKSCYSFKDNRTSDWDGITCKNCELYESLVSDFEELENEEMETRLDILNYEYAQNIRQVEPKKNQYCKKTKRHYKFLCGQTYPLDYNMLDTVTENHINVNKCQVCKYLINPNSKKKTGFTQYAVNELFRLGITNKSSSSKNFCSEDNTVMHYSTIEKIRTENNTLIDNSQCWSAGFASCERNLGICELPLTSLSRISTEFYTDIYSIKVLDTKKAILFTIRCELKEYAKDDEYKTGEVVKRTKEIKYFLYGRDDGQNFLVELYDKPKTVKDAYKSMIPIEGKTKRKILRQGDLFFIPTEYKFKEYEKQHYENLPINLDSDQQDKMNILIEQKIGNRFKNKTSYYGGYWNIKDATTRLIAQYTKLDYLKTIKPNKELIRNQIFDTNHDSQFMKQENNKVFVKGQIIHKNRQHQKLILNKWYQVVKNRVKNSFTIERFGGMGRD